MVFEELIERTNIQYKSKEIALIQKISTPWKVIRNGKQIVSAFPEKQSTVDYIGVHRGLAIAFEAKETKELNRFPLDNIDNHQVEFLRQHSSHGGVSFLLVNFKELDKVYRLDEVTLVWYWNKYQENRGKRGFGSIPLNEFECNGKEIQIGKNGILLNYLEGII